MTNVDIIYNPKSFFSARIKFHPGISPLKSLTRFFLPALYHLVRFITRQVSSRWTFTEKRKKMETDSLSRGFLQRKKIWWWQKRKEERKRKNNYATTIRILWNVAPFILHPRGTNGILRKLSYENAMKLNPRGRSRWRLCSTSLSLSLSLISAVALFSTEKREIRLFRNVRTVSSRFDAFIWEFIMMSQLRRSFAYSNNERWDKKIKKKSRYRVQRVYEQSKERRKRKIERDFRGIRKHARRIMLYIPWSNSGRAFSTIGDPTFPPYACFFPSLISRREFS